MPCRLALLTLLAVLALAPSAGAQLRALSETGTPVLDGDRVLWGERGDGALRVLSAPVAGGEGAQFGSVPLAAGEDFRLAAGDGRVAAVVRDALDFSAPGRLYVAGADGAFGLVAGDVGEEPVEFRAVSFVQVTPRGVLTLERSPFLRDGVVRRAVTLPPDADPELVATAGGLGVAAALGVLIVFDLRSGTEIRQIGLGRFEDETLNGLSISPTGDVAAAVPAGDGSDVLLYAPVGDDQVRVLATGAQFEGVVTSGGRVAFVGGTASRDGVRVSVLNGDGSVAWRGPWVRDATALAFDGRALAFRTGGCGYAGVVGAWEPRLPAGPCGRTEVAIDAELLPRRLVMTARCINAADGSCRVSAVVRTTGGAFAGRASSRVRRGGWRRVAIPLNGRGRRAAPDALRLMVRATDPDGRSRVVYGA
jgi:hypothetical protein